MKPEQKIAWQPNPGPQTRALERREDEILLGGARGGSKTETGQIWLVDPDYIYHNLYRFLVIRKNAVDLDNWLDRASRIYAPLGVRITGKPATLRFPSGAMGWTGHLKDKDAYTKYLGDEYHKILVEELTLIPREEDYIKLISCARSTIPQLRPQVMGTTNPGNRGHIWVKQRFVRHGRNVPYYDIASKKWRIFIPSTAKDTPQLTQDYHDFLDGLPEKLRRAWRDGDWDVFEGQFFDKWDENLHVYKPFLIPRSWPRIRAIDWGYSDPLCCLWGAIGPDDHIYIYRELYRNRLTDPEYAQLIDNMSRHSDGSRESIAYTVGDPGSFAVECPDTLKTRYETFALNGVYMIPADNRRIEGWSTIRDALEPREYSGRISARLHVSEECPNLIRTLPALVHRAEKNVEDIEKNMEDHAPDALRYLVASRAPKFLEKHVRPRTHLEAAEEQMERKLRKGNDRWA